jgi:hypothetical protein
MYLVSLCMLHAIPIPLLEFIISNTSGEDYRLWNSLYAALSRLLSLDLVCVPQHTLLKHTQSVFLSTMFWNTPSLCSSAPCQRPSFYVQKKRQNYVVGFFTFLHTNVRLQMKGSEAMRIWSQEEVETVSTHKGEFCLPELCSYFPWLSLSFWRSVRMNDLCGSISRYSV